MLTLLVNWYVFSDGFLSDALCMMKLGSRYNYSTAMLVIWIKLKHQPLTLMCTGLEIRLQGVCMSAIMVLGMFSLTYKPDVCWKESGYARIRTAQAGRSSAEQCVASWMKCTQDLLMHTCECEMTHIIKCMSESHCMRFERCASAGWAVQWLDTCSFRAIQRKSSVIVKLVGWQICSLSYCFSFRYKINWKEH